MIKALISNKEGLSVVQESLSTTNKIHNLILSIGITVFLAVTPVKAANGDKEIKESGNKGESLEQITAGKSILALIGKILLNDTKDVSIDKKTVDGRLSEYIKIRGVLGQNLESTLKKFIYERYLELLTKGYETKGCDELDKLIKTLKLLNDKIDIKVIAKKDDPDFKDTITIVGNFKEGKFIIDENSNWVMSKKNTSFSSSSLYELISAFEKDIPDDFKQAIQEITKNYDLYRQEKEKLRLALIEISGLNYSLEQAHLSITNIKKEILKASIQSKEDARIAGENAELAKQNALKELKIKYDEQITKLESEKLNKDSKYAELKKQLEEAQKKALDDSEIAKQFAQDNLQTELTKLQEQNDITISGLQKEIERLQKEIGNKGVLINTISGNIDQEKENMKAKIEELNSTITSLKNTIIDFQNQIKAKDEEISKLQITNDGLLKQSTTTAQNSLTLKQQQEGVIAGKDIEISGLKSTNKELSDRIIQLEKEKAELQVIADKVKEMEKKVIDFTAHLDKITSLEAEIGQLKEQITGLEKTISSLQKENTTLGGYKKKADEFDSLQKESNGKSDKIIQLEATNKELNSKIEQLNNRIASLEKELDESKKRETALIESMRLSEQLSKTVNGTIKDEKTGVDAKLIAEFERLKKEMTEKNSKNTELEKRVRELELQIQDMTKKHKEELEILTKKLLSI